MELSKKVKTIFSPRIHSRCQSRAGSAMQKKLYYSDAPETKARTVADSDDVKIDEPVEVLSARSIQSDRSGGHNAPTPSGAYNARRTGFNARATTPIGHSGAMTSSIRMPGN